MRELEISLTYDRGVSPLADVFVDHPELVATSIDVSAAPDGLTRVDRLSGSPEAVATLEDVYLDTDTCNECTVPHDGCDATRTYEVLDEGRNGRTVYTYHEDVSFCHSVPYHARTRLAPGLVFDSTRQGADHEWRLLMRRDRAVGAFVDALGADLPAGVDVSVRRLAGPERWGARTGTVADLSPEQRAAIEEAVRMDYYDTPRQATLADISTALDVPQSTLRYRLRRAEAWLTSTVVTDVGPTGAPEGGRAD